MVNLVDNAVRHNEPGGSVTVATGTEGGRTFLRVTNTGPMILPEDLDRLFQPFQRMAGERVAGGDGLGLGLPIVAAIAAAHDADLDAHPLPTGGLAVEVGFPKVPEPVTEVADAGR